MNRQNDDFWLNFTITSRFGAIDVCFNCVQPFGAGHNHSNVDVGNLNIYKKCCRLHWYLDKCQDISMATQQPILIHNKRKWFNLALKPSSATHINSPHNLRDVCIYLPEFVKQFSRIVRSKLLQSSWFVTPNGLKVTNPPLDLKRMCVLMWQSLSSTSTLHRFSPFSYMFIWLLFDRLQNHK